MQFPVVLRPQGPVRTAMGLQMFVGMGPQQPKVSVVPQLDEEDNEAELGQVEVAALGRTEWLRLLDRARLLLGGDETITVRFEGRVRLAWVILGREEVEIKAGWNGCQGGGQP